MAIVVGTNSYVTEAELNTYATDRGITISGTTSVLLIKAMDYIETRKYIGQKTDYTQTLLWPRTLCSDSWGYDADDCVINYDYYFTSTEVPQDIKDAQMIAAILIDQGYDLQPVIDREVKREKIDVIEVEYKDNSAASAYFSSLQDTLMPYLANNGVKAVRV